MECGLKILSIRVDSIESTRIVRIDWSLWPRFKNEEGSCIVISRILTSGGLCRVGWKCCRFESIWSNRHESFPLLSIRHSGSRFARRDSVRIELRRNVRIESNRKVPQTNRLSLGILDMDEIFNLYKWQGNNYFPTDFYDWVLYLRTRLFKQWKKR